MGPHRARGYADDGTRIAMKPGMNKIIDRSPAISTLELATVVGGIAKTNQPQCDPGPCPPHQQPPQQQPPRHCGWPFGDWGNRFPTHNFPNNNWWNRWNPYERQTSAPSATKR